MKPRELALRILIKITQENAYSHLVLKHALADVEHPQDKALITQIVYGTIQNYVLVRHLWTQYTSKPVKKPGLAILLDMSIYQLRFLDRIPSYAIVNEAVELAKMYGQSNASFVNGVLQSYLRGPQTISPSITKEDELLALSTSHPLWLIKLWTNHYGWETTKQICEINNTPPRHCGRVNTLKTTKEDLLQAYDCKPGTMSEDALYFVEPITHTPAFQQGEIAIQDEGSQLVTIVLDPKPGSHVLDLCAAPGSKTIHMAQRMNNQGTIIAHELHEHRAQLIKANCKTYGVTNVQVVCTDSTTSATLYPSQAFTHVLVDAPCTGFGVLRRKPDIKLLSKPEDIDGILAIQAQLLESVHDLVRKGGTLVYSTCTLNKKENEKQIVAFLSRHDDYELVHEQTLLPSVYDGDGFYIAKMVRKP